MTTRPVRLATEDLPTEAAVVVVGSGFGAAVTAARVAPALGDGDVVVLERGREWVPGEFPEDPTAMRAALRSRRNPLGLFDLQLGTDVDRLTANGLGGGSLVYANVLLEADPAVFDEHWPAGVDAAALRPYADRVRAVLRPQLEDRPTPKADALAHLGAHHGVEPRRIPLAVRLHGDPGPNAAGVHQPTCTRCGNCVSGCNVGAKTTMWASYLPLAARAGARLVTRAEVLRVERNTGPGRRWTVHGERHEVDGHRRTTPFTVQADVVLLGAGSVGTAGILLRSAAAGLPLSDRLGERFSGNADSLSVSYNSTRRRTGTGARDAHDPEVAVGPTITTALDLRDGSSGYLIQDGALPYPVAEVLRRILGLRFALSADSRVWCDLRPNGCPPGAERSSTRRSGSRWAPTRPPVGSTSTPVAARGSPGGRGTAGGLRRAARRPAGPVRGCRGALRRQPPPGAPATGVPAATPITVHPLGGAVMADDVATGVCDRDGRVHHPDGARPRRPLRRRRGPLPHLDGREPVAHDRVARGADRRRPRRPRPGTPDGGRADGRIVVTPRGTASVALLVAAVTAFGAGVVPSVGEAARTTAALRAEAATGDIGAELRLRPASGPVRGLETGTLTVPDLGGGAHRVRVGVVAPRGEPIADLLFLHGHADRLDNHAALFADLAAAGVRVVSFDLPSHGETDAGAIDRWSTADLAALAARVVHATEQDPDRPFVLAGGPSAGSSRRVSCRTRCSAPRSVGRSPRSRSSRPRWRPCRSPAGTGCPGSGR